MNMRNDKPINFQKQRGVALIVVLLIVAMIVIISVDITSRNQITVRRTVNLAQYEQAYWYAMSAEALSQKVLKQDMEDADGTVHLQQYWALADVMFPAQYGQIGGNIRDMRSCFNLNSLAAKQVVNPDDPQQKMPLPVQQFQGLLVALGMDDFAAERLSHTLKDYIDEDTVTSPYGAEDAEYESRNTPYRAANTLLNHKSELRAVMGFNQQTYNVLSPYVCAIPGETSQLVNVNTVKVEQAALLSGMLLNNISVGEAENLINQRSASGFDTIDEFWEIGSVSSASSDARVKSSFVVDSQYFILDSGAQVNEAIFRMESVLRRTGGDNFEVVTRQFGSQN